MDSQTFAELAPKLALLRQRRIYFLTAAPDFLVLGIDAGDPQTRALSAAWLRSVLDFLQAESEPQQPGSLEDRILRLDTLVNLLPAETPRPEEIRAALPGASLSLFGTDGSRGEVCRDSLDGLGALRLKLREGRMSPAFFQALTAAILRSIRAAGFAVDHALVGWDSRDLFVKEGGAGIFRDSVMAGITETGAAALVLGVTPIAASSYALAALQGRYENLSLSFNKTASHNPPSHDGLKTLIYENDRVRKLRPAEELSASAWLMAAALGEIPQTENGAAIDCTEALPALWLSALRAIAAPKRIAPAAIIYDGSNGAAAASAGREGFAARLREICAPDTILRFTSCQPDGRNINDHCGAGAMEGLAPLDEDDMQARFAGFESLACCWRLGRERREQSQRDGRLVTVLATDGDSDRSVLALYDPFKDRIRFLDGDAAILLQVDDALAREQLKPGDRIAFTIESATAFARTLQQRCEARFPVHLRHSGEADRNDAINLVMTPVGDKWVLEEQPLIGGEATGHIIRPVVVSSPDGARRVVHAGNGPLGLLASLLALEAACEGLSGEDLAATLDPIFEPFEASRSLVCYAFFVDRSLLYRDGPVWRELEALVDTVFARSAASGLSRELVRFDSDPDTMLILLREGSELLASIHIRSSGTEPKIGLKASACGRPELEQLFESLDREVFIFLATRLADTRSQAWQRQRLVLARLEDQAQTWAELSLELRGEGAQSDALFETQLRALAKAMEKQGLYKCDAQGACHLSSRGRELLARLRSSSARGH